MLCLKAGVLQPGGTHQHFCLSNSAVLTLPARSQGGMERREEKKETQQNKKLEKLNSGASDVLKGEICS